jgi:protein-disulfide isomerase
MSRKMVFNMALVALFLAFIVATLMHNVELGEGSGFDGVNRPTLERSHAPVMGNPQAGVVIVEFLDPACETCAAFYPMVKQLMAAHPERIRLMVRYAPFHKGSDQVVAALEAARRQDRFWQALEALLAAQSDWVVHHVAQPERIWPHLERAGLDLARLRRDMDLPEINRVIEQDLLDARALNVTKTPEFFVNGRPLPRFGYEPLQALVEEALKATR